MTTRQEAYIAVVPPNHAKYIEQMREQFEAYKEMNGLQVEFVVIDELPQPKKLALSSQYGRSMAHEALMLKVESYELPDPKCNDTWRKRNKWKYR